jgi:hypothetical protein
MLNTAFALAAIGDVQQAQKLVDEVRRQPGASNDEVQTGLKFVDATIRLRRGDPTAADAFPAPKDDSDIAARFLIGYANYQRDRFDIAAERLRQVVERPWPTTSVLFPMSNLYYARTLVKLGKTAEARKMYERLLETWKSADDTLPAVQAARQEYAALPHTSATQ